MSCSLTTHFYKSSLIPSFSVADRIGRRYAMISECCIFCVGVVVQITTSLVWQQVAAGRLISGLAVGALSAVVPMVCYELRPLKYFFIYHHELVSS